jgi:hypothetical protein
MGSGNGTRRRPMAKSNAWPLLAASFSLISAKG